MAGTAGTVLVSYHFFGEQGRKRREAMPTPDMTFITSESHPINILKFQQLFPSWEAKFLAPDPREAGIRLE